MPTTPYLGIGKEFNILGCRLLTGKPPALYLLYFFQISLFQTPGTPSPVLQPCPLFPQRCCQEDAGPVEEETCGRRCKQEPLFHSTAGNWCRVTEGTDLRRSLGQSWALGREILLGSNPDTGPWEGQNTESSQWRASGGAVRQDSTGEALTTGRFHLQRGYLAKGAMMTAQERERILSSWVLPCCCMSL